MKLDKKKFIYFEMCVYEAVKLMGTCNPAGVWRRFI